MTAKEYVEYEERVARYLEGCEAVSTGPCSGCEECDLNCDSCGHPLSDHTEDKWCPLNAEVAAVTMDRPTYQDPSEYVNETYFSWSPCEICKTHLGGDRESWHCVIDDKIVHGTCCSDCAYYLAMGCLDDMTMLDVGKDKEALENRLAEASGGLLPLVACDFLEERGLGDSDDIEAARVIFKESAS